MSDQRGRHSGRQTGGDPFGGKFGNGKIPLAALKFCETQQQFERTDPRGYLAPDASICFDRMCLAAKRDGVDVRLIIGYRDFATQQRMKKEWTAKGKPNYAATPGHSNHGYGTAADINGDDAIDWVDSHGAAYGWEAPAWAEDGVGTEERWHKQHVLGFSPGDCPTFRQSVAVFVNGTLVPSAEGYVEGGESAAWIRPVAQAMGLGVGLPEGNTVTLSRGEEKRTVDCVVEGGQAFVPLRDLLRFSGVRVDWDNGSVKVTTA